MFARHSWYFRNALVRANYKNAVTKIDYTPVFLERFFRNLLLGEQWDLRNRYLHIHAKGEWKTQPKLSLTAGTKPQQDKHRTSTGQAQDKLATANVNLIKLIGIIGEGQMSVKDIMQAVHLKGRDNFLNMYLQPATSAGYVRLLYPGTPRHPRQKYLLTEKGMALYHQLNA